MTTARVLRTLIVDDEPAAIEGLRLRLQHCQTIEVVGEADNVRLALERVQQLQPDLIFLDIEMPEQNGFELIQQLQPEHCPAIVFVTAFHHHAVRAFEVRALDYLLKPIKLERLQDAIARVQAHAGQRNKAALLDAMDQLKAPNPNSTEPPYHIESQRLVIQDGRHPIRFLPYDEILWIDAAGDYMCVHTADETHVMRSRLKNLINEQLPDGFGRIHKSTIVNLAQIRALHPLANSEYHAELNNGKMLKVSRTFAKALKERLVQRAAKIQ